MQKEKTLQHYHNKALPRAIEIWREIIKTDKTDIIIPGNNTLMSDSTQKWSIGRINALFLKIKRYQST